MKLTLEKAELIVLIGQVLGYKLQEEDVTIKAEPFELHIRNVQLSGHSNSKPKTEEEVEEFENSVTEGLLTMEEVLNQNAAKGGPPAPKEVYEENTPLNRHLGPEEYEEPPDVTQAELNAISRLVK